MHGCSPSRPLHSVLWDVLLTAIESRFCAVPLALGKVITSQGTMRVKGFWNETGRALLFLCHKVCLSWLIQQYVGELDSFFIAERGPTSVMLSSGWCHWIYYGYTLHASHTCNHSTAQSKHACKCCLLWRLGELAKIEPTLLQFHSHVVKRVGALFHIQSDCFYPQCCPMDTIHEWIFGHIIFFIFTDLKLCHIEISHFKRPLVKLGVAIEIDTTFCLIGSKPGEGLPSSKLVSKLLLGRKIVMREFFFFSPLS